MIIFSARFRYKEPLWKMHTSEKLYAAHDTIWTVQKQQSCKQMFIISVNYIQQIIKHFSLPR
jgi:hypothetical protein